MKPPLITENLNKTFAGHVALAGLDLSIPAGSIVGLLGRNGSGKTTLLHLACGLILPTSGSCHTFGQPVGTLGRDELVRLGVVAQTSNLLQWMTVEQHLRFQATFYPTWDRAREQHLLHELELDPTRKIQQLSVGDQQKLSIVLGVCHHPELLLMDEPMSALDPIIRRRLLTFLVDFVRDDGCTIIVSSHILADVERIIDWVVCLHEGELTVSASFDALLEAHAEWRITSAAGLLPERFPEPWVLSQNGDRQRAQLHVRPPDEFALDAFASTHDATVERRPLSLEELFPHLISARKGTK